MRSRESENSSGVSETIGFIIILGIVMAGIGLVTLYGYPALLAAQHEANVKNMQKNMIVLQSDLKSLTSKYIPYQETVLQISGGTLLIQKDKSSGPVMTIKNESSVIASIQPGELRYISDDQTVNIALENGAVHTRYWSSPTGSVMLAEPWWFYDPASKTYVVQLIILTGTEDMARTGVGTVKMHLEDSSPLPPYDMSNETITVTYQPDLTEDYRVAWKNYFSHPELRMTAVNDPGNITYSLTPEAETLVIKQYTVTISSI